MSFDTAKLYIQSYRPETTLCTLLRSINQAMLTVQRPFMVIDFIQARAYGHSILTCRRTSGRACKKNTFGDDGVVAHQKASETKFDIVLHSGKVQKKFHVFPVGVHKLHMKIIRTVVTKGLIEHGWKMQKDLCSWQGKKKEQKPSRGNGEEKG